MFLGQDKRIGRRERLYKAFFYLSRNCEEIKRLFATELKEEERKIICQRLVCYVSEQLTISSANKKVLPQNALSLTERF